jgi:MscS family membrane protein
MLRAYTRGHESPMQKINQFLIELGLSPESTGLFLQVFLVVFAVMLANFVLARALKVLLRRARKTDLPWDDAALDALRLPLRLLVWLVGLAFAAEMVGTRAEAPIFAAIPPIRTVGVIFIITWFLVRLTRNVEHALIEHNHASDRATVEAIAKLLRLSAIITGALIGLQSLGFSVSGVLAFGGIGGIAVGFATKDMLANFFGAFIVYIDRPFVVGDWIRSPDKDIEGTVEEIGWRLTRIRRFDKRPLYVPNSIFTQIAVENPSRMTHRRILETIGIRYADIGKMQLITDEVRAMLVAHPEIDENQTMIVHFDSFNASSLDFFVYTFTHTTAWVKFHEIKQDVLLKVAAIIDRHGAEIAFPTRTLHLPEGVTVSGAAELRAAALTG